MGLDVRAPEPASAQGDVKDYGQVGLGLAEEALQEGGLLRLQVRGDSMLPALRAGEVVLVKSVKPEALRQGDLVVVRRGEGAVTHRVIGRQAGSWLLKGDNRWRADPPLEPQDLLGRVIAIERRASVQHTRGESWDRAARRAARLSAGEAQLDRLGRSLIPGRAGAALGRLASLPLRIAQRLVQRRAGMPGEHP